MGLVVSGCGACYASSHTECIHDDCHPMSGVNKSLERFMKMEEEFVSSVKCLGNHLNDLEKLDMRLGAQENCIRSIRLKLQGLIHGSAGISNGYAGMPNIQNNLNSQTVINNQTTMNTNNTCINNNFSPTFDVRMSDNVTYKQHGIAQVDAKDAEIAKLKDKITSLKRAVTGGLTDTEKGVLQDVYNNASVITKGKMQAQWEWLKNDPVKPIVLPKKDK